MWALKMSFNWYPILIYHRLLFVSIISKIKWLPVLRANQQVATGGKERADKEYFNKSKLYLGFDRIL